MIFIKREDSMQAIMFQLLFQLLPFFLIFAVIIALYYFWTNSKYIKTEYFKITHNKFLKVLLNKGLYGEYLTYKYLRNMDGYHKFLFNVYLPKVNGETTEIDVLFISQSGIFVFESKNYSGWIFGKENQRQWTMTLPSGNKSQKFHFLNPIMQNELHIKWLKASLSGYEGIAYHSIIAFSDRCTLKKIELTEHKAEVIKRSSVKRCVEKISKQNTAILTEPLIQEIYDKLYPLTQVSVEQKQKHIDDIKKDKPVPMVESVDAPLPVIDEPEMQIVETVEVQNRDDSKRYCTKCGKEMVLRTAKTGENAGKQFWGCSGFPKCRNTIEVTQKKDVI